MNPYGTNFEFNTSKFGGENPTFSSSSSLSKPRMAKSRKSLNSKYRGSLETLKNDKGYNPFQPVKDNVIGVSSRVDNDVDGLSNSRSSRHMKLKVTNKVEKVGNELIDEIRKLRIANQSVVGSQFDDSKLNDRVSGSKGVDNVVLPSVISQELKRMNLGGSNAVPLGAELPNDLRRLNLRDRGDVGGGRKFGFDGKGSNDFVFGKSRGNVESLVDSTLPENIKNLNLEDPDKNSGVQKEKNVDMRNPVFVAGNNAKIVSDTMVLGEMEKLNIGGTSERSSDNANLNASTSVRNTMHEGIGEKGFRQSNFSENVSTKAPQAPELNMNSGLSGISLSSKPSFPLGGFHYQPVRGGYQVPSSNESEKREGFSFTTKQDGTSMASVEFRTPDPKGNLFTGSNANSGFRSKKGTKVSMPRGRKGKVKEPNPVLVSLANNISPMETSTPQHEPSVSYSPMDVSPCYEIQDDAQSRGETSLTRIDSVDEQLVTATERMDINEGNDLNNEKENMYGSECTVNTDVNRTTLVDDCVSATEDVSFKTATEDMDNDGQSEVESKYEEQDCDQTRYFSASSSISSGGSSFKFAASSSHGQPVSAAIRHLRKKNRMKVGPDIYIPPKIDLLSDATSSLQFSPIPEASVLLSQVGQNDAMPTSFKSGVSRKPASPTSRKDGASNLENKKGITSPTASSRAAQEACEKWRLRGNQAYANGDLKKAEDSYTQGLSCIPRHETSRDCLRSLVLCYSNRAAARMSIGRMSEALQDCLVAAEIDPNFFRVQLRAANCYLALGKIGNASRYFKILLQSTDACVERKIILEASDGLQKAQKVSECIDRSTMFLQQRTLSDTESALGIVAEALVISPYSEELLESKAEALFMLRRYEEVIKLCEETLEAAEKNFSVSGTNELSSNMDAELLENYSFCTWRFSFIFKSNFYLGKLEEALEFLEKQEKWSSVVAKCGKETPESLIPQLSTVRELIRHKSAGNVAFQRGRHTEAVEHYSAALSFNVESRPFAAVCFGNRAAAYQSLGHITDAVADCSLAIALDANYLKAISRRATLFEMIRDYDQAAKDLDRIVSLLTTQAETSGGSVPIGSQADLRQARQRLYQMEEQAKRGIPLNFYLILGVEPSVSATDLKKAYRKAALRHHPDKAGQSLVRSESGDDGIWKEIAEEVYKDTEKLFKMIGEAYAVLSDPTQRSQYDIEEEMRNGMKKNSNMSRTPNEASVYSEERGGAGRQWREGWRSSTTNPYSRGFEPTRPGRYY